MDLERAIVIEDLRFDYGEMRFIAYAPIEDRLHVLGSRCAAPCCARSD
jgi:uncharacterized DUF497 family protein